MDKKMLVLLAVAAFVLIMIPITLLCSSKKLPKIGSKVPQISLKDDNGKLRSFSEFKGKKMVIYFYPKDDTPGCKKEACSIRDNYGEFQKKGIVVIGISYDSPESHKKFKEKYHLPFILLSDPKKEAAKAFGAYGGLLRYFVPRRITFLVNEKGEITNVIEKVDPATHAGQVLKLLK